MHIYEDGKEVEQVGLFRLKTREQMRKVMKEKGFRRKSSKKEPQERKVNSNVTSSGASFAAGNSTLDVSGGAMDDELKRKLGSWRKSSKEELQEREVKSNVTRLRASFVAGNSTLNVAGGEMELKRDLTNLEASSVAGNSTHYMAGGVLKSDLKTLEASSLTMKSTFDMVGGAMALLLLFLIARERVKGMIARGRSKGGKTTISHLR